MFWSNVCINIHLHLWKLYYILKIGFVVSNCNQKTIFFFFVIGDLHTHPQQILNLWPHPQPILVEEEVPYEPDYFHMLTISSFLMLKYRILTSNQILTEPPLNEIFLETNNLSISS